MRARVRAHTHMVTAVAINACVDAAARLCSLCGLCGLCGKAGQPPVERDCVLLSHFLSLVLPLLRYLHIFWGLGSTAHGDAHGDQRAAVWRVPTALSSHVSSHSQSKPGSED